MIYGKKPYATKRFWISNKYDDGIKSSPSSTGMDFEMFWFLILWLILLKSPPMVSLWFLQNNSWWGIFAKSENVLCLILFEILESYFFIACEKAGLGMVFLLHRHHRHRHHHQKDLFFNLMQYFAKAGTNFSAWN